MLVLQQRSGAALETFLWIAAELDEELDCQKCITLRFSEVLAAVEQYGSSDMPDDFVLCRQLRLEQTLNFYLISPTTTQWPTPAVRPPRALARRHLKKQLPAWSRKLRTKSSFEQASFGENMACMIALATTWHAACHFSYDILSMTCTLAHQSLQHSPLMVARS